jgi:GH15 family glucan-1,4-alpha-glucosidase
MASRIEDYGLIGNTHTAALVSRSGSVDWLCAPRFDSDACFASLIGYDEHGSWAVRPTVAVRENRQALPGRHPHPRDRVFVCDGGAVRVIDFMPMNTGRCDLVRIVEGLEGEIPLEMVFQARFGFGHDEPWITEIRDGLGFTAGPDSLALRAPFQLKREKNRVAAFFTVKKGERLPLQLTWHPSHLDPPDRLDADGVLGQTEGFWRDWSGRCAYQGRFGDAVLRSLITLKG